MHRRLIALATVVGAFAVAATASAHVGVTPGEVETGSFVHVHHERPEREDRRDDPGPVGDPRGPDGLLVRTGARLEDHPATVERPGDRARREGQDSLPEQFQRFSFIAAAPDTPTTLVWKAFPTAYRGGEVVRWTGEPGEVRKRPRRPSCRAQGSITTEKEVDRPCSPSVAPP